MNRKLWVSLLVILVISFLIFFLWEQAFVLSALLLLVAYFKHRLYPIKSELLWFVSIVVAGSIIEIAMVNINGAWTYTSSQIFNIPLWIPIFWGTIGTTLIVLYEGIIEQKKIKSK